MKIENKSTFFSIQIKILVKDPNFNVRMGVAWALTKFAMENVIVQMEKTNHCAGTAILGVGRWKATAFDPVHLIVNVWDLHLNASHPTTSRRRPGCWISVQTNSTSLS
jgi:hypothetical protein